MLVLDFINVGNGDSILVREMEGDRPCFSMLVDCGHDSLERDDHPPVEDARSCRIYAGDFLRKQGVEHLDLLLVTHFHRDHIGGLGRVLEALLDKYMNTGIYEIEKTEVLKLDPFMKMGKPAKIASYFGGKEGYLKAVKELEDEIYAS